MRAVWERHGWDGESRVTRVEFRYKRECLHEMEIEDPYDLLDKLPALWAYSSAQWLRHTTPTRRHQPRTVGVLALLARHPDRRLLRRGRARRARAQAAG